MKRDKFKNRIIIILLLVAIISVGLNIYHKRSNNSTEILSENIEEQISKIAEVSTVKYNFTDVVSYENSKQFSGMNIPFTNKSFIVKYGGYIKAGTDVESIKIDVVDNETVNLNVDKAKILENTINEEDVAIFDEKDGIFNKLNYEELYEVLKEEKAKNEKSAISRGILTEADENISDILRLLLEELGFKNINIKFNEI